MIDRRKWLAWVGSVAGGAALAQQDDPAASGYRDKVVVDAWMRQWIGVSAAQEPGERKAPNGALHVGRFADPMYYLTRIIGWTPEPKDTSAHQAVRVPEGFVTDFASIPRLFWSALRPDGRYTYAAIVHDYLYWEQYTSREHADDIFSLAMEDFRIPDVTIKAIWAAVRVGGGSAWDDNAALKARGEQRVLKVFPSDPRITWSTWKARPGVFG